MWKRQQTKEEEGIHEKSRYVRIRDQEILDLIDLRQGIQHSPSQLPPKPEASWLCISEMCRAQWNITKP